MSTESKDFQLIDSYSRKQAIEDGVLVDVEKYFSDFTVGSVGFNFPIAMTSEVFNRYVKLNPTAEKALESEKGRMLDILSMLMLKIKLTAKKELTDTLIFWVICTVPIEREPNAMEMLEDNDDLDEDEDYFDLDLENFLNSLKARRKKCWLKSVVGANDDLSPCITIMFLNQD